MTASGATSSGWPTRPSGVWATVTFSKSEQIMPAPTDYVIPKRTSRYQRLREITWFTGVPAGEYRLRNCRVITLLCVRRLIP